MSKKSITPASLLALRSHYTTPKPSKKGSETNEEILRQKNEVEQVLEENIQQHIEEDRRLVMNQATPLFDLSEEEPTIEDHSNAKISKDLKDDILLGTSCTDQSHSDDQDSTSAPMSEDDDMAIEEATKYFYDAVVSETSTRESQTPEKKWLACPVSCHPGNNSSRSPCAIELEDIKSLIKHLRDFHSGEGSIPKEKMDQILAAESSFESDGALEDHWRQIWDTLYPGDTPPTAPYLPDQLISMIEEAHNLWFNVVASASSVASEKRHIRGHLKEATNNFGGWEEKDWTAFIARLGKLMNSNTNILNTVIDNLVDDFQSGKLPKVDEQVEAMASPGSMA